MGNELEGEEHRRAEYVERTPVHMTWYRQGRIRQEVGPRLADQSDDLAGRSDSDLERVGDMSVRSMEGETNVMICAPDNDALHAESTDGIFGAGEISCYAKLVEFELGR